MSTSDFNIELLGPQGDGIHELGRSRVYVERGVPGDRVRALIQTGADGLARAEIQKILEPSPLRQAPPCEHYDRCGNCSLQHIQPEFYRAWKTQMVQEAFRKQGLRPRQWIPTVFLGGQNRRRVTFAVVKSRGQIHMGYYRRRSREIADIDTCLVADPSLLALRKMIKPFLVGILKEGKTADVFLQKVGDATDMVVTGPVGASGAPDVQVQQAVDKLLAAAPISRVSWRPQEQEEIRPLANKAPVVARFGVLQVHLPPASFLQPTLEGEQALTKAVMAALPSRGRYADLFSGCGTFSGQMVERGPVDAFESIPRAVSALSKAAAGKPLKVFRRDLFRNPLRRDEINRYDAVVFDPPRSGCPEQAMEMSTAKTGILVGVSCNPATFARDARILCEGGYWLQSVQVVDQFLWSHHVEVVAVFTKRKRG